MSASKSFAARLGSPVALLFAGAVWLVPYVWMTAASFRSQAEIEKEPFAFVPTSPTLDAYRKVFELPIGQYFLTTVFVALSIAVLQTLLALPAGYALAKLHFVGKRAAFAIVLGCLLIPAQVTFVPVFTMFARAGLVNTLPALILPFAVSAFGTFMVRQALLSVPDAIIEAARLDGASELTIIYRLLGPMLRPTLVSMFLLSFVFHYSDYFWPLVMTTDDRVRTLPIAVALLRDPGGARRWDIVMAGSVVLSVPMLALFAVAQRHILRAVTARG